MAMRLIVEGRASSSYASAESLKSAASTSSPVEATEYTACSNFTPHSTSCSPREPLGQVQQPRDIRFSQVPVDKQDLLAGLGQARGQVDAKVVFPSFIPGLVTTSLCGTPLSPISPRLARMVW